MRKIHTSLLVVMACLVMVGGHADQPEKRVMNFLAVMDLKCGKDIKKEQCAFLTNVVIDELVKSKKYTVIDRANRDKILGEAGFQMSACVDESCTVEAGRILGAGKIITGSVDLIDKTYFLNIQLINVETAAVEASATKLCECDFKELIDTIRYAARNLVAEPQVHLPATSHSEVAPPSRPETPKRTKGKCPEDMVYIPEGNFCIDRYEYPNKRGVLPRNKVSILEARQLCHQYGKRLPTISEWRQACMGPHGYKYPYGNKRRKKFCNVGRRKLMPSGSFPRCKSAYGVYDMSGNVFELVEGYPKALGGGHINPLHRCSCNAETGRSVTNSWTNRDVGFRCAKDAE